MKGKPTSRPKAGSGMIQRHKNLAKARERGKYGKVRSKGTGTYWGAVKKGGK